MTKLSTAPHLPSTATPLVSISQRAAARLRQGHVWIYRSDLAKDPVSLPQGTLVSVGDERGHLLGSAFYSTSSQIALRMLSSGPLSPEQVPDLLRERIRAAIQARHRWVENTNAYRVVFSEADQLPGLIVDRYNDIVSFQLLTQAMDQPAVRETVIETLTQELNPTSLVERIDSRIRELEQLPPRKTNFVSGTESKTILEMNGVRFHYDAVEGQKTGAFLDQRENYAAAARYAKGSALDVFTYHGGFALHLAQVSDHVEAVDSSRPALETAEKNEALNALKKPIDWTEADAFELLKDYSSSGKQYDTIILDPPAFAKNKKSMETAMRGYKELNLRAMKMIRPGGVLVTCSCSYHVSEPEFLDTLSSASTDARRSPVILERRSQAKDHPVLLNIPETGYLKCVILGF